MPRSMGLSFWKPQPRLHIMLRRWVPPYLKFFQRHRISLHVHIEGFPAASRRQLYVPSDLIRCPQTKAWLIWHIASTCNMQMPHVLQSLLDGVNVDRFSASNLLMPEGLGVSYGITSLRLRVSHASSIQRQIMHTRYSWPLFRLYT